MGQLLFMQCAISLGNRKISTLEIDMSRRYKSPNTPADESQILVERDGWKRLLRNDLRLEPATRLERVTC